MKCCPHECFSLLKLLLFGGGACLFTPLSEKSCNDKSVNVATTLGYVTVNSLQKVSHNSHPDCSGQQFKLRCPVPRHTGICLSPFKGLGIFEIPLPVCLAWRAHIACSQLTMVAPCSKCFPAWSTLGLLDLLTLWGEEAVQSQLHSSHRNFVACWIRTTNGTHQCRAKIKELRQTYQKARESNCCSDAELKTCFYRELDAILGGSPASTTKSPVDTSGGLETADSGFKRENDVVDKEVELEDEMGQATGLSCTVASQDLFLTQEGFSQSQHSISGPHDAGEGALMWPSGEPPTH
ncbi:uncharacterized protein LOC115656234 [Gopherus evgoodei]|uniref:uncharacterized protein LOC115656234 n=1 Tax=Gopherus evgoodei TaxID=1825980 RepID=UPI0011CF99E5|nr:uncharacterized protein LOC115656234 [Gopherus evgoodei]